MERRFTVVSLFALLLDADTISCCLFLSVQEWRFRFARDVLHHVSEKLCSAHPINYTDILALDHKLREFETYPLLTHPLPKDKLNMDSEFTHQHPLSAAFHRETGTLMPSPSYFTLEALLTSYLSALLHLHQNFFARAMINSPNDPMSSPFAPSVIASYHSASCILRIIREAFERSTLILQRVWLLWAQALSSAVTLTCIL